VCSLAADLGIKKVSAGAKSVVCLHTDTGTFIAAAEEDNLKVWARFVQVQTGGTLLRGGVLLSTLPQ